MSDANHVPNYAEALALLMEYNQNDSLLKHAYSVEAAMRKFANYFGEDTEKWGIIGLIHDLDYEKYPDRHCLMTQEILEQRGWPPEYVRAAVSHGWGICNDVEPQSRMEKVLYAIDELTGLVKAVALMRPSRSLSDLEARSVMKKWKDKAFAAGVERSLIEKGALSLGMELNELVTLTIDGMRQSAVRIGL
ncbi:MAG TPA: hydrolase [Dehalococcoidales bacterium]|nr:hydrolase [Dehalococcoidales bacterium]